MPEVIRQCRSGAQTGVDIASLRAARSLGIPTGGTMPRGFKTLAGPKPEWAREFGLTEHASAAYLLRTYENVRDSDMTVRIAVDFTSAGERCTASAIRQYGKPTAAINVRRLKQSCYVVERWEINEALEAIRETATALGRPIVVNFAGNSEKTAPGIERFAEGVVRAILEAAR